METLTTNVNGKEYVVILHSAGVWVRGVRTMEDGSKVQAFLSIRQRKVEAQVRGRFAKEINAHLAKIRAH